VGRQNQLVVRESQETEGFSLSRLLIYRSSTGKSLYFDQFIAASLKKLPFALCLLSWYSHQSSSLHIVIPAKNRGKTVELIILQHFYLCFLYKAQQSAVNQLLTVMPSSKGGCITFNSTGTVGDLRSVLSLSIYGKATPLFLVVHFSPRPGFHIILLRH